MRRVAVQWLDRDVDGVVLVEKEICRQLERPVERSVRLRCQGTERVQPSTGGIHQPGLETGPWANARGIDDHDPDLAHARGVHDLRAFRRTPPTGRQRSERRLRRGSCRGRFGGREPDEEADG
jgi:hypothetical protein